MGQKVPFEYVGINYSFNVVNLLGKGQLDNLVRGLLTQDTDFQLETAGNSGLKVRDFTHWERFLSSNLVSSPYNLADRLDLNSPEPYCWVISQFSSGLPKLEVWSSQYLQ